MKWLLQKEFAAGDNKIKGLAVRSVRLAASITNPPWDARVRTHHTREIQEDAMGHLPPPSYWACLSQLKQSMVKEPLRIMRMMIQLQRVITLYGIDGSQSFLKQPLR